MTQWRTSDIQNWASLTAIQNTSLHHTVHEPPPYSTRVSTIQNTSLHHTVHESLQYRTNCFQHWCMCLKKKFYSFFQHGCRGFPPSSGRTRNKTLSYTDDLRKFQKKNNFLVFYIVEYIWIFICFEINTVIDSDVWWFSFIFWVSVLLLLNCSLLALLLFFCFFGVSIGPRVRTFSYFMNICNFPLIPSFS